MEKITVQQRLSFEEAQAIAKQHGKTLIMVAHNGNATTIYVA